MKRVARLDLLAGGVLLVGLLARVRLAMASYLNPDEAWVSLLSIPAFFSELHTMAGRMAHPPLFVLLLHYIKLWSQSEMALRSIPLVAGAVFPWFVYKWLERIWSKPAGFIALLVLTLSPFLIALSAQARGYTLALLGISAALYLLETSIERRSAAGMAGFTAVLYGAILTEYSVAFFTAAAGVYALLRFAEDRPQGKLLAVWAAGQAGAAAIYALLAKTHVQPRLEQVARSGEFEIWLRDLFPQPDANPAAFAAAGTFRQFAYAFASETLGAVALMLFLAGITLLWMGRRRAVVALLTLPFALTCAAAFLRLHPYSFSRHSVFLSIFIASAVAVTLDWLASSRLTPIFVAAALIVPVWQMSALHDPGNMQPGAQQKEFMYRALGYLRSSLPPDTPLLTDTETRQILGHYLAEAKWLPETNYLPSEERIGEIRVFAARWSYSNLDELRADLGLYRRRYQPGPGRPIWVMDAGFSANLIPLLTEGLGVREVRTYGPGIVVFQVWSGE